MQVLLDDAVAGGLGSAAALSIGDGGREVERFIVGTSQRTPEIGAPITAATRFDLASLTKPIATAALAMTLASRRALELAAPVRRYVDGGGDATIAQLLGHAAGCVAHVEFFHDLWAGRWDGEPTARRALISRAVREPLATAPGTTTTYSDLGYIQLGAALERAGGAPLEELFAREVAGPLGLAGAGFVPLALPDRPTDVVATEIDPRRGGLVRGVVHDENSHSGGGVAGHAGLFATIDDVARFAEAITALAAGEARGAIDPAVATAFITTAAAPTTTWRLGFDTPSPDPGVSHAGDRWPRAGAIGHTGFTGTSIWLDLPRRRWVVLLTNRVHPTRDGTADAIKALRRAVGDAAVELLDR